MFGIGKLIAKSTAPKTTGLSYCETAYATGTSPHHIRVLTDEGMKTGGGADTPALCGTDVAWDTSAVASLEQLEARITHEHPSNRVCVPCREAAHEHLA
jgi:hypothetical protein